MGTGRATGHLITKGQRRGGKKTGEEKYAGKWKVALLIKANLTVFTILPRISPVYFLPAVVNKQKVYREVLSVPTGIQPIRNNGVML